ncbi:MAG: hypothetical protein LIP09_01070 [Bacteroidales bacterium]|nr:hypothetical protein [Bacteroidales bacterium]
MTKTLLIAATAAGLVLPMSANATGLVPEQTSFDHFSILFTPLSEFSLSFDGAVDVYSNPSTANIYCDGKVIETAMVYPKNEVGQKRTQGWIIGEFPEPLVLPKGQSYKIVLPVNTAYSVDNPELTNDEITLEFEVPEDLGPCTTTIEEGSVITTEESTTFFWGTETAAVDPDAKATLYREGEPVREFSFNVTWDWDLGQAYVDFGETLNFENGINYSLVLPAGSVSAQYRMDITNLEAVINFVGGYTEPLPTIDYVWCSLFTDHPTDNLGEVSFYYKQPVMLAENPEVQLWIEEDNELVKSVVPTLVEEDGKWVLTADFEETPLIPEKGYTLVIPEGTLISASGDVVVNYRKATNVPGISSGIESITEDAVSDIYSIDGVLVKRSATEEDFQNLPEGIYIFGGCKLVNFK